MMSLLDKILNGDLFKAAHGRYADTAKNRRLHRVGQEYGHAAKEEVPGPGRKPAHQDDEQKNPLSAKLDSLSPAQLSKIVDTADKKIQEFKDKGYEQGVQKLEEISREARKRLMGEDAYNKDESRKKKFNEYVKKRKEYIGLAFDQMYFRLQTDYNKGNLQEGDFLEQKKILEEQKKKMLDESEGYVQKLVDDGKVSLDDPKMEKKEVKKEVKEEVKEEVDENSKKEEKLSEKKKVPIAEVQEKFNEAKKEYQDLKSKGSSEDELNAARKKYHSLRRALRKLKGQDNSSSNTAEVSPKSEEKEPNKNQQDQQDVEVESRLKFDDIPNSGKVKLAKYLSEKRKTKVDKDFESIKNLDRDTVQTLHDALVKKFNDEFDGMAKADRAEALYKIAKIKNDLQTRPAEPASNKTDSDYSGDWFEGDPSKMTKDELAERSVKHIQNFLQMNNLPVPEFVMSEYPDAKNKFQKTGHYSRKEGKVYLNAANTRNPVMKPGGMQWSYPGYKVDKTPLGVLAHEIGHHIDHTMKFDENAFPYKGEKVTGYEPTVHEAIAESLRLFMLNPDLLHTIAPKRYQFFLDNGLKPTVKQSWKDVLHGAPQEYFDQIDKNYSGKS